MSLNRKQVERVRVLTGHLRLDLRHVQGWDEQLVEDYLAMIDELEERLAVHYEESAEQARDRHRRRLCNLLGIYPGPEFRNG